jgi:autophagy-related protein 2
MLRFIAPVIKPRQPDTDLTPQSSPTRPLYNQLPPDRTGQYVIDDLDAQASSFATIQPSTQKAALLAVQCPLVRIDIRCPAPPSRRGSWGDDAHLRSGIVTLDIHGLAACVGQASGQTTSGIAARRSSGVGPGSEPGPSSNVEWQKMILFFCRVPGMSISIRFDASRGLWAS